MHDDVFEQIFEGHPDAWSVVELDRDQIFVVRCNQAQARRFGMTPSELQMTDLRQLVAPEHYAGWLSMLESVAVAGEAQTFEYQGPPLVGGLVRATMMPLRAGASGLARFFVHIQDETSRQLAQRALVRSEARLAQAQRIGKTGDWELDLVTGTGTWSREMFRIMGWHGAEPPTLEQFEALAHLDDRKSLARFHRDVLEADSPQEFVFRLVTPSGDTRRIAVSAVCTRDPSGKPVTITGVNRDITGLEESLESARRHGDALEVLFEENVNGVYFSLLDEPVDWDNAADKDVLADWALEHARPVRVNRALCAIFGAEAHELIGRPLSNFFPDRLEGRKQFRALYDAGRLHLSRTSRLRADGTRWLADLDLVVTRDQRGRITGQFGTLRDVTEQERAAEALRRSEARLALALESAELYVWTYDLRTQRIESDPRWPARFGYTIEEFADREFARSLVNPTDQAATDRAFADLLAGNVPSIAVTYRLATRSEGFRWIEIFGKISERDASGAPLQISGICRDVTEQRTLEQRLLAAERMASLGTLAAGIGHEINNPLTYLSANLALMDDALDGFAKQAVTSTNVDELRRMLRDARDGVMRIVRIVKDLRSLSRGSAVVRQRVDLKTVLERCLELAEHEIRHRANVQRNFEALPEIVADEGRLIQLFLNLLVNAAQAINEGAADSNFIRVSSKVSSSGGVVVEVEDTGKGMEPDVLSRIFDPFFTTKNVGEGIGLGLPICHSIVRDLGGSIEAESVPGRGSLFRVRLPRGELAEEPVPAPAPPEPPPAPKSKRLRILVIDDEATVGRLLTRILSGHEVVVETRAGDALVRLKNGEGFDRILCDVMMPETSGVDFYELVKKLRPELLSRILFMTGGAFSARAAAFLAAIPNVTLEKPFDPVLLRATVEKPPPGS
ncbi:MAG TPA: PAS domain S-box protein [Polyangiaceae bacterium]|nr:PAS domain S-box protein [Polyangiaceae bacterium]